MKISNMEEALPYLHVLLQQFYRDVLPTPEGKAFQDEWLQEIPAANLFTHLSLEYRYDHGTIVTMRMVQPQGDRVLAEKMLWGDRSVVIHHKPDGKTAVNWMDYGAGLGHRNSLTGFDWDPSEPMNEQLLKEWFLQMVYFVTVAPKEYHNLNFPSA